jgi:5-methylcytosine-specific restriction endonuclease McrA
MMSSSLAVALIAAAPVLSAGWLAFSTPGGVLSLCVSRRTRYAYRRKLMNRGWRPRSRAQQRSSKISARLRRMVERADRHRCAYCRTRWQPGGDRFPVDHMVPWVMGGLTCLWNCALLCKRCNTVKSCYWVAPSGHVYYRGKGTPPRDAPLILAAERAARRSLLRWLRAYGLLPSW